MALMGEIGTRQYVGSAFVTFPRPIRDRFWQHVQNSAGPKPEGAPDKDVLTWLKPGTVGLVRHLRGEENLRHARLFEFRV